MTQNSYNSSVELKNNDGVRFDTSSVLDGEIDTKYANNKKQKDLINADKLALKLKQKKQDEKDHLLMKKQDADKDLELKSTNKKTNVNDQVKFENQKLKKAQDAKTQVESGKNKGVLDSVFDLVFGVAKNSLSKDKEKLSLLKTKYNELSSVQDQLQVDIQKAENSTESSSKDSISKQNTLIDDKSALNARKSDVSDEISKLIGKGIDAK